MEKYRPSTDKRHIGLMGGTFDPIHHAHLIVAEEVRTTLALNEIVFIPAGLPPHKVGRGNTEIQHRLAMVQSAIASNQHFTLSRIEVDRPGPSYLVDTLRLLHKELHNTTELSFIIGWDSLAEFHTWYDAAGILAQLSYLIAVQRPGYEEEATYKQQLEARLPGITERLLIVAVPQMDISATDLRRRVTEGKSIKYQTPEAVERYILEHDLYQTKKPEAES